MQQRMASIVEHLDLFHCGVRLYVIGEHDAAIELFSEFVRQYPSREVYNNRGLCYYQKALALYSKWKPEDLKDNPNFVFKLSAQIDPVSQARILRRAIQPQYEQPVLEAIKQAFMDFKEAERLDWQYAVAQNNLGCAHLLKGELAFARGYFEKAIQLNSSYKEAYNNLGVCYVAEGNAEKGKLSFLDAGNFSPIYSDPYYNLGQLYTIAGRPEEAKPYYERYLQLDENSGYAAKVRAILGMSDLNHRIPDFSESIGNIPLQNLLPYGDNWRHFPITNAKVSIYHDKEQHVGYFYYRENRYNKTIRMAWTEKGYHGESTKLIQIGNPDQLVRERYPFLRKEVPSTLGAFWIYRDLGFVFEMRYGKVDEWYIYLYVD